MTLNRIKADVLGLPVAAAPGDAAVGGVAMLAGLGVGLYRDSDDAIARAVHLRRPIQPDRSTSDVYAEAHATYRALLDSAAVRPTVTRFVEA